MRRDSGTSPLPIDKKLASATLYAVVRRARPPRRQSLNAAASPSGAWGVCAHGHWQHKAAFPPNPRGFEGVYSSASPATGSPCTPPPPAHASACSLPLSSIAQDPYTSNAERHSKHRPPRSPPPTPHPALVQPPTTTRKVRRRGWGSQAALRSPRAPPPVPPLWQSRQAKSPAA